MRVAGGAHLTYCTNVHAGESWAETAEQLRRHLPPVKARVSPAAPFGVGLRLSARAAAQLAGDAAALDAFRSWLAGEGLYVFTINGFPFGTFHGTAVKDAVYRPDWRDPRRLAYSDTLALLLADLLDGAPEDVTGSVSTVPGGYKAHMPGTEDRAAIVEGLLRHAATLDGLARERGRVVVLALEPEPGCLLETVDEAAAFFAEDLFGPDAVRRFAALTGRGRGDAEAALRRHLGLCLDTCHAAVMFEDAGAALDRLAAAGVPIAKIQVSSGLVLPRADASGRAALLPFAEGVYLHQTAARAADGTVTRFADLPDALASDHDGEWRVHFHVPVWAERCGPFATTQGFTAAVLERQRRNALTAHLEVETYTWDVLPHGVRPLSLTDSLALELQWTRERL